MPIHSVTRKSRHPVDAEGLKNFEEKKKEDVAWFQQGEGEANGKVVYLVQTLSYMMNNELIYITM